MTLKPLVFFGTEQFSLPSLQALIDAKWPVELVVTKPDSKRGRGLGLAEPAVKSLATKNNIPVTQPEELSEIEDKLITIGAELAVLVAYGKIIPQEIIDIFPLGIINVHPSLLPKYRGPAPIEAAILNGDDLTGVSLMRLSAKMDAGPVYAQSKLRLSGNEKKPELYATLAQMGASLLLDKLDVIASGKLNAAVQDDSLASYTQLLKKDDGLIDFEESALVIERKIRAYANFPKAQAVLFGQRVIITSAHVVGDEDEAELIVKTSDGLLQIDELIAPSGRKMSSKDFIRGYRR